MSASVDPGQIKEALTRRIANEYAHWQRYYQRLWAKPLQERVRRGRAIGELSFREVRGKKRRVVLFRCRGHESRFRQGDVLRLSRNTPAGSGYEVTWYGEDEDWIGVVFFRNHELEGFVENATEESVWTLDESYVDLQSIYYRAFEEITATDRGRELISPILAGSLEPSIQLERLDEEHARVRALPMNDTQKEAAAVALAASPYALIQGTARNREDADHCDDGEAVVRAW